MLKTLVIQSNSCTIKDCERQTGKTT